MSGTRLYFAYGSNLHPARLQARTPSARIVGAAELPGNRLEWHKHGADDSGKCDIIATDKATDRVHGAVYEIDVADWHHLDVAEELDTGYHACRVEVQLCGSTIQAHSYRALVVNPALRPFDWYQVFVVKGARAHGLPEPYIASLDQIETWPDPSQSRARLNRRLLAHSAGS